MPSQANPRSPREVAVTGVFHKNYLATARTVVNIGGARSSKSHSIAQLLVGRGTQAPLEIYVMRKTGPALKRTAQRLVIDLLADYGRFRPDNYFKQEGYYNLNGGRITFMSLDDSTKARSMEANYIWLEEGNEFTFEDYLTLRTRLSRHNPLGLRNQILISLNPDDVNGWIHEKLISMPDVKIIHSTYKDNPFLDEDYIKDLEALKDIDLEHYSIFALGEWGRISNLIYPNIEYCDALPDSYDYAIRGLDFGFNNPTSLVKLVYKDGRPFAQQEIYKRGLNNRALLGEMETVIPAAERSLPMYADTEAADRIDEIACESYNVLPAYKGPGSVNAGILSVQGSRLVICDSPDLEREAKRYKWAKDRAGKILDVPVKFEDHGMDAIRYAHHTHHLGQRGGLHILVSGGS